MLTTVAKIMLETKVYISHVVRCHSNNHPTARAQVDSPICRPWSLSPSHTLPLPGTLAWYYFVWTLMWELTVCLLPVSSSSSSSSWRRRKQALRGLCIREIDVESQILVNDVMQTA